MNTHIAINNPEELDAFVQQFNKRVLAAQHQHIEETLETLERRMRDLRSSLEYSKSQGKECEIECNLGNIIAAASSAIARCPKTINSLDAYRAIRSEH